MGKNVVLGGTNYASSLRGRSVDSLSDITVKPG